MTRAQVLTTLVLLVGLAGAGVAAAVLLPAVSQQLNGQPAADFQANTVDGRVLTSDYFRCQAIAVNFFASWCPALCPSVGNNGTPLVVHFPIVLLVLEAAFVWACWVRPSEPVAWSAHGRLWTALISFVPAVYTGIRDVGAALELPGWVFWNELKDRVSHLFRFQSSISLHVLFVLAVAFLTSGRLTWRDRRGDHALQGRQGLAFATGALLGVWLPFAAAQIGGGISHP
jgi:hypothetical protein